MTRMCLWWLNWAMAERGLTVGLLPYALLLLSLLSQFSRLLGYLLAGTVCSRFLPQCKELAV